MQCSLNSLLLNLKSLSNIYFVVIGFELVKFRGEGGRGYLNIKVTLDSNNFTLYRYQHWKNGHINVLSPEGISLNLSYTLLHNVIKSDSKLCRDIVQEITSNSCDKNADICVIM